MNDIPRQKLREIIQKHGVTVCDDRRRIMGLLVDYLPGDNYRLAINLLMTALDEEIVANLQQISSSVLPLQIRVGRLVDQLCKVHGLREEAARWAVESWAWALGISLPSHPLPPSSSSSSPPSLPLALTFSSLTRAQRQPRRIGMWVLGILVVLVVMSVAIGIIKSLGRDDFASTSTPMPSSTATLTNIPTKTPTRTPVFKPTATATSLPTNTPVDTPTSTATVTPQPSPTATSTPTSTLTPTPQLIPTVAPSPTFTVPVPTQEPTSVPPKPTSPPSPPTSAPPTPAPAPSPTPA
ncbi:MAG: hypothetical protein GY832_46185 [Chloroflexi bacterium]|nr:hypothetical protein [Chloroflexota bacterium]